MEAYPSAPHSVRQRGHARYDLHRGCDRKSSQCPGQDVAVGGSMFHLESRERPYGLPEESRETPQHHPPKTPALTRFHPSAQQRPARRTTLLETREQLL